MEPDEGALFGASVAMDASGQIVAIGAPANILEGESVGSVSVFKHSSSSGWVSWPVENRGSNTIWGSLTGGAFGASVASRLMPRCWLLHQLVRKMGQSQAVRYRSIGCQVWDMSQWVPRSAESVRETSSGAA